MASPDPTLEFARQLAREAVGKSSLRRVATEIGISHPALAEFVAEGSTRMPYGAGREKLIQWAAAHAHAPAAESSKASYFRGKQDALMGMIQYIATQQAEIGKYLSEIDAQGQLRGPSTPYVGVDEAEEAEAVLDQLPPPPRAKPGAKPDGRRRRA